MKQIIYICLMGTGLFGMWGCTSPDRQAYESCRQTIARSVKALPLADGVKALEDFQKRWQEAYGKAARKDSIHMNRILDVPGIGAVEFKAPPEV